MEKRDLITTRDANKDDISFIYATWLRGLRHGNSWFELIIQEVYYDVYHRVIENIIKSSKVTTKVACLKDDPGVILGYAVYSSNRLDWVYVKKAWRSIGIAKMLVPKTTTTVSHITAVGIEILNKHKNIKFNPFDIN